MRGGGDRHVESRVEQTLDARGGTGLVAPVFGRRVRGELHPPRQAVIHAEVGEPPHVEIPVGQRRDGFIEIQEAGLVEADRGARTMTGRGDVPAGRQKLVRGLHQIVGGATQLFRIGQHDDRMVRQHAGDRLHVVDEGGQQGFHAFDRNRVRDRFEHVLGVGDPADQAAGPFANRFGELHLAAGRRPDAFESIAVGALVGGMELPDRVDLVAEELDAHRMGCGGREHVEQTAADGELAAVHHQVDAGVRVLHQPGRRLVERQLLADGEEQRLHIAQTGDDRLDQRAHGHHQNADRAEHRVAGFGMTQPAEDGHTAGHGVGAWRQAFVRQRLPRLQLGDVVRIAVIPGAQRVDGLLGLTAGCDEIGDRGTTGHGCGKRRTHAFGGADDDRRIGGAFRSIEVVRGQRMEARVPVKGLQQPRQRSFDQLVHCRFRTRFAFARRADGLGMRLPRRFGIVRRFRGTRRFAVSDH